MSNSLIPSVDSHKHLGVFFSNDCSWHDHIDFIKEKAWKRINVMKRLKFQLDRKSLQIIYFSFIRPIIEYADVVWDNCTQYEKSELEKVQHEAARIVTGCTKLVSINHLNSESGWESLENRRLKHKLILFYKMQNDGTPEYLSSLIPETVGQASQLNLRNSDDYRNVACRTVQYSKSFIPSVIDAWNLLSQEVKDAESIDSFKCLLNRDKPKPNKLFLYGERRVQVLHARLRNDCSSLNQHLFSRSIIDSPLCRCGISETTNHYLMICPLFSTQRRVLFDTLSPITNCRLKTLLYGDDNLSMELNETIFLAVHAFISSTKRFSN